MKSTTIVSSIALLFALCHASPMVKWQNIKDQIIEIEDLSTLVRSSSLPFVAHNYRKPSRAQAAGIKRSKIGYTRISKAESAFTIPPGRGTRYSAHLAGSVKFEANLASVIESKIAERAGRTSSKINTFYRREQEKLRNSLKSKFFCFWQAAATEGYTDTKETEEILEDSDYESWAKDSQERLEETEDQALEATYDATYSGVTMGGPGGLVKAYAYISVNQITLDNGNVVTIVQDNPELLIVDENKDILDKKDSGYVDIKLENLSDLESDITLD